MDFDAVWKDQEAFQRDLGLKLPRTREERIAFVKELVLHLHSETDELLRAAGAWKIHRRVRVDENRGHIAGELADIFKLWMVLAQEFGFTPEQMIEAYWSKSAGVRQRHSEEWLQDLTGEAVIVDIDGVLGNYVAAFADWAHLQRMISIDAFKRMRTEVYVTPEVAGVEPQELENMRHRFRLSQGFRYLYVYEDARAFLNWIRDNLDAKIILLTARPIHDYPNLYEDTLCWLRNNDLPFDCLWWARDKNEAILTRIDPKKVLFAVDDEARYITKYQDIGLTAFHLIRSGLAVMDSNLGQCRTLDDVIIAYDTYEVIP